MASVQNTPHIPRAPAPFATKDGYSKLLIGAVPTPIGEIATEVYRDGDMVIVEGIREVGLCEHHLLPIIMSITIAYVPDKKILGLS